MSWLDELERKAALRRAEQRARAKLQNARLRGAMTSSFQSLVKRFKAEELRKRGLPDD